MNDMQRLKAYIKSCQAGEVTKKAFVLEYGEILKVVNDPTYNSKYWLLRKTIACLAYFGGHRTHELKSLNIEDLKITNDGIEVSYVKAKQRGVLKVGFFGLIQAENGLV